MGLRNARWGLRSRRLRAARVLLVGAGGLGSMAIQIARAKGAIPVGTGMDLSNFDRCAKDSSAAFGAAAKAGSLMPSRAHDNGLFLIFSNGVGMDDNEVRTGNAMILDPYGRRRRNQLHPSQNNRFNGP